MNVALPALIVFLLVLPGFIFRDRFKRTERTVLDYAPFGRVVAEGVIWAAVLHAVWLVCAWVLRDQLLRLDIVMGLLSANPIAQTQAIVALDSRAAWVAEYFASLLLASIWRQRACDGSSPEADWIASTIGWPRSFASTMHPGTTF